MRCVHVWSTVTKRSCLFGKYDIFLLFRAKERGCNFTGWLKGENERQTLSQWNKGERNIQNIGRFSLCLSLFAISQIPLPSGYVKMRKMIKEIELPKKWNDSSYFPYCLHKLLKLKHQLSKTMQTAKKSEHSFTMIYH